MINNYCVLSLCVSLFYTQEPTNMVAIMYAGMINSSNSINSNLHLIMFKRKLQPM